MADMYDIWGSLWSMEDTIRKGMKDGFDLKIVIDGYCFLIDHHDFDDINHTPELFIFEHKSDKPDTLIKLDAIRGFEWVDLRESVTSHV